MGTRLIGSLVSGCHIRGFPLHPPVVQCRHDAEQNQILKGLGTTKTERDINMLMRQHTMEKEACEAQWSSELSQLQETQRREYREWVLNYEENLGGSGKRGQWVCGGEL